MVSACSRPCNRNDVHVGAHLSNPPLQVFFASAMFNVIFWPLTLYQKVTGGISAETTAYVFSRRHIKVRSRDSCLFACAGAASHDS